MSEELVNLCLPNLREVVWHTDGRITAKTGANAPKPKKLYSGKTVNEALLKLWTDNSPPISPEHEEALQKIREIVESSDTTNYSIPPLEQS